MSIYSQLRHYLSRNLILLSIHLDVCYFACFNLENASHDVIIVRIALTLNRARDGNVNKQKCIGNVCKPITFLVSKVNDIVSS